MSVAQVVKPCALQPPLPPPPPCLLALLPPIARVHGKDLLRARSRAVAARAAHATSRVPMQPASRVAAASILKRARRGLATAEGRRKVPLPAARATGATLLPRYPRFHPYAGRAAA